MTAIILPSAFDNLSLRKDGSVSLKFDTRELSGEEITTLLGFRNTEGWLQFSQSNNFETPPDEKPNLDLKSPSELLRNALYVRYLETKQTSTFQTYYNTKMEQIRQSVLKDLK
jgi:hypothetical protein